MEDNLLETAVLRIQMLGPFQVWRQQEILAWPTQKSKALFQILLIEPGKLIQTDQILEYLWPDFLPRKAQNNLWVTVSQLRRVLQPDLQPRSRFAYILKQGEGYRFNPESNYWLDGDVFAAHLGAAQSTTDLTARIKAWEAARILYQGDFLEDEPYAEWAQFPRTRWRRRYEQLLANLADAYGRNGRFRQAITHCREILILDNANESAYRLLMRCHAALGERATALKVYGEAVQSLQDEIGVDPMQETAELAQQIKMASGERRVEIAHPPLAAPKSTSPFVGRGNEMNRLQQCLGFMTAGQGQTVLITGEPGAGKSRVAQETSDLARRQGCQLLIAHCYQVEQSLPYQPLIDLARQALAQTGKRPSLPAVWQRELAVLLPEISEETGNQTIVSPDELEEIQQGRLFQSIFHFLTTQATSDGLMILIEDIHWADPATLQFLHYLTRQTRLKRILLLCTLRSEAVATQSDLALFVNGLRREPDVTILTLNRLTQDDVTALLVQTTDTAALASSLGPWLYQETDGNPFFIVSLIQSLREGDMLKQMNAANWHDLAQSVSTLSLPEAIQESVNGRLQRLPQPERHILDWLAVYGTHLTFPTLQAISQQPQMSLLNNVEQLTARQLLVETNGEYNFSHDKIREVVYHALSAARRSLYHRQVAHALAQTAPTPETAAILAYHFEQSGEKAEALTWWMQAGAHALDTYAYQQASHHYEQSLALADQPPAQMDAYLGLGRAFMLLDDADAAASVLEQGAQLAQQQNDTSRLVHFLYRLAQNASRQHRSDAGHPEVEAALTIAEKAGDDTHLAQSLLLLVEVYEGNGNLTAALETAIRAHNVSRILENPWLEGRALAETGFLHAQLAEFDQAAVSAERGLALLRHTDDQSAIAYTWNILGRALGGRGDYDRALNAFHRSHNVARMVGDRYLLSQIPNMIGWLHRELCSYETALELDKESVELAQRWGKLPSEISAQLNVCLDILYLDDPARAMRMLDEIGIQIEAGAFGFHSWRWRLRFLHIRGLCFLALRQPADMLPLAEDGLSLAATFTARKYMVLNHELRGLALAELGSVDKAIAEMETAVSLADAIQYQPIRWNCRCRLAQLYQGHGRESAAQTTRAEAESIIQTIAKALEDEKLRTTFLNAAFSS